ncbi:MAG: hypothetical protein R3A80_03550 [Bdellovibrionota bacterium]
MKDYHDAAYAKTSYLVKKLKSALNETLATRGTELKTAIAFDKGDVDALQKFWVAHIRTLKSIKDSLKLPNNFECNNRDKQRPEKSQITPNPQLLRVATQTFGSHKIHGLVRLIATPTNFLISNAGNRTMHLG